MYGSLGLVASSKRSIRSGAEFDKLFDIKCEGKEVQLLADGDVYDTVKLMKKIVRDTLPQTKGIADRLKGNSRAETSRNVWNFLYSHVQYKKDHPLREQLRTPSRAWRDRKKGVDCDCYTIFISSILNNLGIPHYMRMAGYKGDFQHIYVVVPKQGKSISGRDSYFVIDPVVNKFDYEEPFNKKSDTMSEVTMLNGFGSSLGECNPKPIIERLTTYIPLQQVIDEGGVPTRAFLEENSIPFAPSYDKKSEKPVYVVCMANGMLALPAVLSPQQANELKANAPTSPDAPAPAADPTKKKLPWLWIAAIVGGTILLFTGSDQQEVKSGLDGVSRTGSKKKKSGRAKSRSISI